MITLADGDWALSISPDLGASIFALTWRGRDILRPAPAGTETPLSTGNFPLAPYANRIAEGRFVIDHRAVRLSPTAGFEPHALHGLGWLRSWTVLRSDARSVSLDLKLEPSEAWPWAWTAAHRLALSPEGLEMTLSVTNEDLTAMPTGLGLHPYFVIEPETVLTVPAPKVWLNGSDEIPRELAGAAALVDWSEGVRAGPAPFVDNAYAAWAGVARLEHENHVVELTASANARWAHVFAPGGDFACVEPVTHRPNAHNAPSSEESGLVSLERGQTLSMSARITARSRQEI